MESGSGGELDELEGPIPTFPLGKATNTHGQLFEMFLFVWTCNTVEGKI